MTKIDVKREDDIDDITYDKLYIYRSLMSLLNDVKITQGPTAVSATLRRHPVVSNYLLSFQKDTILRLEGKINFFEGS